MPFTVLPPPPTISSFTPTNGIAGDSIAIVGTNFTGTTSVKFNRVPASFMVQSNNQIIATVPSGCSSGVIEVKTLGETATSGTGFTVNHATALSLTWQDEGNVIATTATSINFVGAGVTISNNSGMVTVAIPGDSTSPTLSSDPYFSNVVLLIGMNGENNSTNFNDIKGHIISLNGNVIITTAESRFGGSSAYFDGSGDYLIVPDNADFDVSVSDFTIEFWAYVLSGGALHAIDKRSATSVAAPYTIDNGIFYTATAGSATYNVALNLNPNSEVWQHFAVARSGNVFRAFKDGVLQSSAKSNGNLPVTPDPLYIGYTNRSGNHSFSGYMGGIRITKGVARYKTNFILPTVAFPVNT